VKPSIIVFMLKGREVVYAVVEIRVYNFGLVGPRNDSTRKYLLFLIVLIW
jgi:hypothetical protein